MDSDEAQVLIAGAGPTGLTLANALAAYGIPFSIIDKSSGPSNESKGLALHIASQYGLNLVGVGDQIGKSGCRVRRLNVLWEGRRMAAIDLGRLDFHINTFITQAQSITESELVGALESGGGVINWNTSLVSLSQTDDHVEAVLKDPHGKAIHRRYQYVVGCEGKHSVTREYLGATMEGYDYPMYFVLGDFTLNWGREPNEIYYYVFEDTFLVFVPISSTHWRVVVKFSGTIPTKQTPHEREIIEVVERYMGQGLINRKPTWLSRARFYLRTVNRLRKGRVFIAGDAAHLYSPIGGSGMNTGIQDALNLAWKLCCRLKGVGTEALLESYESERLQIIRETAVSTDLLTKAIALMDDSASIRDSLLPKMSNRKTIRAIAKKHSGLAAKYNVALEPGAEEAPEQSPQDGSLCTDRMKYLLMLRERNFDTSCITILIIANVGTPDAMAVHNYLDQLSTLRSLYPRTIQYIVFVEGCLVEKLQKHYPHICVLEADVAKQQGIQLAKQALVEVYPDAVIGFSGTLRDTERLRKRLNDRFVVQD